MVWIWNNGCDKVFVVFNILGFPNPIRVPRLLVMRYPWYLASFVSDIDWLAIRLDWVRQPSAPSAHR